MSKLKMTSIQWDSQQFYQPPPAAIPSSTFWPPSHPQAGIGSTYFQPSIASARFEEVKRTITHGAAQKHITSSSDQVELPSDQGQSLQGIREITQDIQYSGDAANVSDAETEFPSIEEFLLPIINGSLSSVRGNVTDSDKLKLGTSQDDPILLDSDMGNHSRLEDDLYPSNLALEVSSAEKETPPDLSGRQAAPSDAAIQTTVEKVNDMPLFASRNRSNLETESCFSSGRVQETSAISKTDGILAIEGNVDKYQPKSTSENGDRISAKNDDGDDTEPDLEMRRSDDRSGSTGDIDDENHVNDSSGSDIERHPRCLKRRRETKNTEDSTQTNFSNAKEASFPIAASSNVSNQGTAPSSSDFPLESPEIPVRGVLTLQTSQLGILYYCFKLTQEELPSPLVVEQRPDISSSASRSSDNGDWERPPSQERTLSRPGRHSTYSEQDNKLLKELKEDKRLSWDEIAEYFPERTKGTLQVYYSTKLKSRSQTSKSKKRKMTNSAKESGERYSSSFSMELLDPQLRDAIPSTLILPATADSDKAAHGSILSTGNKEHTAAQPRCSSQGVESDLVAIDATEGICQVEALLAKSTVRNVVWYLVKWAGFRDEDNTWQKRDDISSDLINDFEASYQGNYFGVQLLRKRERRGKIEYFVVWKGRPVAENSWEKEVTISRERILEFEAK